jgi:hypothetical protein
MTMIGLARTCVALCALAVPWIQWGATGCREGPIPGLTWDGPLHPYVMLSAQAQPPPPVCSLAVCARPESQTQRTALGSGGIWTDYCLAGCVGPPLRIFISGQAVYPYVGDLLPKIETPSSANGIYFVYSPIVASSESAQASSQLSSTAHAPAANPLSAVAALAQQPPWTSPCPSASNPPPFVAEYGGVAVHPHLGDDTNNAAPYASAGGGVRGGVAVQGGIAVHPHLGEQPQTPPPADPREKDTRPALDLFLWQPSSSDSHLRTGVLNA